MIDSFIEMLIFVKLHSFMLLWSESNRPVLMPYLKVGGHCQTCFRVYGLKRSVLLPFLSAVQSVLGRNLQPLEKFAHSNSSHRGRLHWSCLYDSIYTYSLYHEVFLPSKPRPQYCRTHGEKHRNVALPWCCIRIAHRRSICSLSSKTKVRYTHAI